MSTGNWLSPAIRALVARRGKDSPYLFYCLDPGHNMPGTMTDPDYVNGFIFRLKLKLPKFANGLYRKWKVGPEHSKRAQAKKGEALVRSQQISATPSDVYPACDRCVKSYL